MTTRAPTITADIVLTETTEVKALPFGHGATVPGVEYVFGPDFWMAHPDIVGHMVELTIRVKAKK